MTRAGAAFDGRDYKLIEMERVAQKLKQPDFLLAILRSAAATSTASAYAVS